MGASVRWGGSTWAGEARWDEAEATSTVWHGSTGAFGSARRGEVPVVQGLCWAEVVPNRFFAGKDSAREVAQSCLSWHP